jgi:hypothetical protein
MDELERKAYRGYNLNRRKKYRNQHVDNYIGITKKGALEMGITKEDTKLVENLFLLPIKEKYEELKKSKTDTFIEH